MKKGDIFFMIEGFKVKEFEVTNILKYSEAKDFSIETPHLFRELTEDPIIEFTLRHQLCPSIGQCWTPCSRFKPRYIEEPYIDIDSNIFFESGPAIVMLDLKISKGLSSAQSAIKKAAFEESVMQRRFDTMKRIMEDLKNAQDTKP